jgi:hypothetical protein
MSVVEREGEFMPREKRQRTGALQTLADFLASSPLRRALWTAAALCRFWREE